MAVSKDSGCPAQQGTAENVALTPGADECRRIVDFCFFESDLRRQNLFNSHHTIIFFYLLIFLCMAPPALAGGGGITANNDRCIVAVGFYEVHLTVYQPDLNDNEEFCSNLPDMGQTIFVLNYLHSSLKEVPVELRIIKNVTGLGKLVRWENVQQIMDVENNTVFYSPPGVEPGGSYRAQHRFTGNGDFIGIVTAGHPDTSKIYQGFFTFSVGAINYVFWLICLLVVLLSGLLVYAYRSKLEVLFGRKVTGCASTSSGK